jgi:hypothetical protein
MIFHYSCSYSFQTSMKTWLDNPSAVIKYYFVYGLIVFFFNLFYYLSIFWICCISSTVFLLIVCLFVFSWQCNFAIFTYINYISCFALFRTKYFAKSTLYQIERFGRACTYQEVEQNSIYRYDSRFKTSRLTMNNR